MIQSEVSNDQNCASEEHREAMQICQSGSQRQASHCAARYCVGYKRQSKLQHRLLRSQNQGGKRTDWFDVVKQQLNLRGLDLIDAFNLRSVPMNQSNKAASSCVFSDAPELCTKAKVKFTLIEGNPQCSGRSDQWLMPCTAPSILNWNRPKKRTLSPAPQSSG